MRTAYLLPVLFISSISGCVILPKDAAMARDVLDTRGAIGEALGEANALNAVFAGTATITPKAKAELGSATNELRCANALFYLKALPLVAAGDAQAKHATAALQDVRAHAALANGHLTKAEVALKSSLK